MIGYNKLEISKYAYKRVFEKKTLAVFFRGFLPFWIGYMGEVVSVTVPAKHVWTHVEENVVLMLHVALLTMLPSAPALRGKEEIHTRNAV